MSTNYITVIQCTCERCGHIWISKGVDRLPNNCANKKCNSPLWNRPKTRDSGSIHITLPNGAHVALSRARAEWLKTLTDAEKVRWWEYTKGKRATDDRGWIKDLPSDKQNEAQALADILDSPTLIDKGFNEAQNG